MHRAYQMVIEYIRYQIPAEQQAAFTRAYRSASDELASSHHCIAFEISQGVEEPDHFTVRIEWDSVEGHEKGFRGGESFASFFGKVQPFFTNILEMKHYDVITTGTGRFPR